MAGLFKRMQSNLRMRFPDGEIDEEARVQYKEQSTWQHAKDELKVQVRLASPVVLGYLLQMAINLIVLFFVGHTGSSRQLAAVSLANMYVGMTGLSVIYGLTTAMDTLCAQEFGRDPKSRMVGVFMQRGIIVCALCFPVIVIFWAVSEPLLILLHQDAEIAQMTGYYTRVLIAGLPFIMVFECMKKYMQAQGYTLPIFITMFAGVCLELLICYLLIIVAGMGFRAAPIAIAITWASLPVILLGCMKYMGRQKFETWDGWSREAFKDLKQYFKFGVPGMIMLCNEWWAFEVLALLAGILGEIQLAAQVIVLTSASMMFMIPFGISVAASVRVGNMLGAGMPQAARLSAKVALGLGSSVMLFEAALIIAVRRWWGYLFTDEEEVVQTVAKLLLICAAFQLLDGIQGVLAGVVRGLGKQGLGAAANFVAYYVIGLPIGVALAFPANMDIYGLWWGLCISLFCCVIAYGAICLKVPWVASIPVEDREIAMDLLAGNEDEDGVEREANDGDADPEQGDMQWRGAGRSSDNTALLRNVDAFAISHQEEEEDDVLLS